MEFPVAPFGEIQVTLKDLLTYANFHYNINTEIVTPETTNGGAITQSGSTAILSTSADPAGTAEFNSRMPARYLPGQGMLIVFSAKFSAGKADSLQEAGYGDEQDGFLFEYNGTEFGICRRSSVSGESVNHRVAMAQWSEGGIPEFNPEKFNVYGVSFQWLGAGEIVYWIEDRHKGVLIPVHKIRYANTATQMSLYNPSLRLHAHVENTGATSDTVLEIGNMAAYAFGKRELVGPRQAYRASLAYTTGAERTVLAIENMADVFSGSGNNRSTLHPTHLSYATDGTKNVVFRVKLCTITGGTNGVINANTSIARRYTGTPTVSNEKLLFALEAAKDTKEVFPLPDDILLAPGEAIVVTAESTANSDIATSLSWKELL